MRLKIRRSLLSLLLISGPIVFGFSIYFSCRSSTLLYYQWIPYKKSLAVEPAKAYAGGKCSEFLANGAVSHAFIFSLPAALFAFSLTYYLKNRYISKILASKNSLEKFAAYLITMILIAYVPEYLQLVGAVPGHFDMTDVVTAGFAALLALYIY